MRKIAKNIIFSFIAGMCIMPITIFAQTNIESSVISSSGGRSESGLLTLMATIGQISTSKIALGENIVLFGGFIHTLDVAPTIILSSPNEPVPAGEELNVSAIVNDATGVQTVTLKYRQGGDSNYLAKTMFHIGNNQYQTSIPGDSVNSSGIAYFVEASDLSGNLTRNPENRFISHRVSVSGLTGINLPGGSEQNTYRIVSFPLNLQDKSPKAILEDDLGSYGDKKWRLFNQDMKTEYPNSGNFEPGSAYWLIVKNGGKIDCGPGVTNRTDSSFEIDLQQGWNLVGNPYNFNIPVNMLSFSDTSAGTPELQRYKGNWRVSDTLKPFEGYAIYSNSEDNRLIINPDLSAGSIPSSIPKLEWSINILAQSQEAMDNDNVIGICAEAMTEWDNYDRPEPPVVGEYVSVYFPHREWEKTYDKFRTDIRPEAQNKDGIVWEFTVQTNINDKVRLTFKNLEEIPQAFEIWVADEHLSIAVNIREQNHFEVAGSTERNPKHLKLIVGTENFVSKELATIEIPTDYELSQNFPNPFNPTTTIRFGLPQQDRVTLTIYNVLGQRIVTLMNKSLRNTGFHTVIWDGKDSDGISVASGMYIYRIESEGGFSMSQRLILVK